MKSNHTSGKKNRNKSPNSVLTGILSMSHSHQNNNVNSYENKVIMDARRKLTQTNKNLLSALDFSNSGSPVAQQLTPNNRRNRNVQRMNNSG